MFPIFHSFVFFCSVLFSLKQKKKTSDKIGELVEKPKENLTPICMNDREDFLKHPSTKGNSEPTAAALRLTDEFGKIGHARQKCVLPSEKL